MANPYQYMNPIGAALVGVPEAYRAEEDRERNQQLQQTADEESARQRDAASQQRDAIANATQTGQVTPEAMQNLAQSVGATGNPAALDYAQKSQQMTADQKKQKMAEYQSTTSELANSLMHGTPVQQQQSQQKFDAMLGAKSKFEETEDPDTGDKLWNVTQVDKDGVEHKSVMNEDQMNHWASPNTDPIKMAQHKSLDEYRKAQVGLKQQSSGQKDIALKLQDKNLDEKTRHNMVIEQMDQYKSKLGDKDKSAMDDPDLQEWIANTTLNGGKAPAVTTRNARVMAGAAKIWKAAGSPNVTETQAQAKSDTGSLVKLTAQTDFLRSFGSTADINSEKLKESMKNIPDFGVKWLNKPVRDIMNATGDRSIAQFRTYIQSLRTEYGNLIKSNPLGATHVQTEKKFNDILSDDAPVSTLLETLDTLRNEGKVRVDQYEKQKDAIINRFDKRNDRIKTQRSLDKTSGQGTKSSQGGNNLSPDFLKSLMTGK